MNLAATAQLAPPLGCAATSCVGSPYVSVSTSPAIQAAGVCTPLELNTYLNDVTSGPFTSGGQLANMLAAGGRPTGVALCQLIRPARARVDLLAALQRRLDGVVQHHLGLLQLAHDAR